MSGERLRASGVIPSPAQAKPLERPVPCGKAAGKSIDWTHGDLEISLSRRTLKHKRHEMALRARWPCERDDARRYHPQVSRGPGEPSTSWTNTSSDKMYAPDDVKPVLPRCRPWGIYTWRVSSCQRPQRHHFETIFRHTLAPTHGYTDNSR